MASKAMDLFEAYAQDKLPKDEGYIVSSFFNPSSAYSKYEIVSYSGVKSIYLNEEGITFQTNGKKDLRTNRTAQLPQQGDRTLRSIQYGSNSPTF